MEQAKETIHISMDLCKNKTRRLNSASEIKDGVESLTKELLLREKRK